MRNTPHVMRRTIVIPMISSSGGVVSDRSLLASAETAAR
jgi:hypothetical protein